MSSYWVIGFHRYHAAVLADVSVINVRLMKGSYADAVRYAMSANWENGLRPNKEDAGRSIALLMETAPDFEYDSKRVIKWLETFGIPKSTARNNTKTLREALDVKRDAKILELAEAGESERTIAKEVGCSAGKVNQVKQAAQNERAAQNEQDETPDYQKSTEDCPFDADEPFFDESERVRHITSS